MGQAKNRRAEIAELKAMPKGTTGLHNHRLYHGTTETVARLIIDQGRTLHAATGQGTGKPVSHDAVTLIKLSHEGLSDFPD
jgi:hypothetical protein